MKKEMCFFIWGALDYGEPPDQMSGALLKPQIFLSLRKVELIALVARVGGLGGSWVNTQKEKCI